MDHKPSSSDESETSDKSPKSASKKGKKSSKKKAPVNAQKATRSYPIVPLEKALIVALKIKELNGGNPWTPKDVSTAIDIGGSQKLFNYTAASRDFGFTTGTSGSKEIALTDFGRSTVYAPDAETELKKKTEAFLKIEIFKNVLEHYKGSSLPEMKYLSNTLQDKFKLRPEFHDEFSKIFAENCKYLGITSGTMIPNLNDNLSSPSTITVGETRKGAREKLKAFVIMPFSEKNPARPNGFFKEVLESLIVPAGINSGFNVDTANKQGSDVIQSTIINDLLDADLVICDLTDHNPNVLFELGLRMAQDKPIALIKSKDTGRIFDVDNMLRVYEYNQNLWPSTVESDVPGLIEHFKAAWASRENEQTYMKILVRSITISQESK